MDKVLRYVVAGLLSILVVVGIYGTYFIGSRVYSYFNTSTVEQNDEEEFVAPKTEVKIEDLKTFYDGFVKSQGYVDNELKSEFIEGDDLFNVSYDGNEYRVGYSDFYQCVTIYDAKKSATEVNPQPIRIIYLYEEKSIDDIYNKIAFYLYDDVVNKEDQLDFSYDKDGNIQLKLKE